MSKYYNLWITNFIYDEYFVRKDALMYTKG